MANVQNGEEDQTDVCDEEVLDIPRNKCGESLGERNDDSESQTVPGHGSSTPRFEGQSVAVDVLSLESPHKRNMADANARPSNETSNRDDVQQPVESLGPAGRAVHEAEKTHSTCNGGGPVRYSSLGSLLEQSWSAAVLSKSNEDTATRVDVGAGSGKDDRQENSVEDIRKGGNSSELDGNDQRRRASVCVANSNGLVVVRDKDSNEENGEDEKSEDAPECVSNGLRHGNTGVGGLSGTDGAQLSALESETSLDEHSPETNKLRNGGRVGKVGGESTRRIPVLETNVALRSNTTSVHDDGENPEAEESNNLDGSEPEFEFSKNVNRKEVDGGDRNPEDCDENGDVQVLVPPLDDESSC